MDMNEVELGVWDNATLTMKLKELEARVRKLEE